ncbi:MAG: hypothetical protein Q9169_007700, partial [Polycauliona sp. 2 TL-2023]
TLAEFKTDPTYINVRAVSSIEGSCEGHALFPNGVLNKHEERMPTYEDCVDNFQTISIGCMIDAETDDDKKYGVIRAAHFEGEDPATTQWQPFDPETFASTSVTYMMGPSGTFARGRKTPKNQCMIYGSEEASSPRPPNLASLTKFVDMEQSQLAVIPRQKSSLPTPSMSLSLDRLPTELQHAVCAATDKDDIPKLRLTCKSLAEVGRHYLFSEVELLFTRQSFDRLADIAQSMGSHVRSLTYHTDLLDQYSDEEEYEEWTACDYPDITKQHSDQDEKAHDFSDDQVASGWDAYSKLWSEQESLRNSGYGKSKLITVMSQMSGLKHVSIFNGTQPGGRSPYFHGVYDRTLLGVIYYPPRNRKSAKGVLQLYPFIEALQRPIESDSLKVCGVNWKVLDPPEHAIFEMTKSCFSPLKRFGMELDMWQGDDDEPSTLRKDRDQCQAYFDQGKHLDLLRAMTRLEHLNLCFASGVWNWSMEPVFADLHWLRLRVLQLKHYKGTDQYLLSLLQRHSRTLRVLALFNHKLTEGLWLYTLRGIRSILNLDSFMLASHLGGSLHGATDDYGESDDWIFPLSEPNPKYREFPAQTRIDMEDFVLGRNNPLIKNIIIVLASTMVSYGESSALSAERAQDPTITEARAGPTSLRGPVLDGGFADPSVTKVGDTYYAYATNENGVRCPAAKSSNFKDWTAVPGNNVLPNLPPWAAGGKGESVWGPDVNQVSKGHFVMYTTAVTKENHEQRCIGAATADHPLGPFKPESKPIISPRKSGDTLTNVIGGAGFQDRSSPAGESRYLLYGERVLIPGQIAKTRTMAQPVSADGLRTIGDAFPMTVADGDEGFVNESPSVIWADDTFVMFFSTHAWYDPAYTISCATAKSLKGPWKKQKEPILKTGMPALKGWTSPGSGTVLGQDKEKMPGGGEKVKYVFHATKPGTEGNGHMKIVRSLWTAEFLVKDGRVRAV